MNIIGLENINNKNKNIVSLNVINEKINLDYKNVNVFNYENSNVNIYDYNFDILIAEIIQTNTNNIKVNKVFLNSEVVYCISFIGTLILNIKIEDKIKKIDYKYFVSHSFKYKNIDDNFLISPVDLSLSTINNKIYFSITYLFLDESEPKDKFINFHTKNSENNNNESDFYNFNYIDTNKEFL